MRKIIKLQNVTCGSCELKIKELLQDLKLEYIIDISQKVIIFNSEESYQKAENILRQHKYID